MTHTVKNCLDTRSCRPLPLALALLLLTIVAACAPDPQGAASLQHVSGSSLRTAATASHNTWPLISRGKPAYCSTNNVGPVGPQALVDGHYGNWAFWNAQQPTLPSWCAIHVGAGPTRLLLTWELDFSYDYIAQSSSAPRDYRISVSSDSTNGADGTWHTVISVQGNQARVREHLLPFAGQSWVKMTVTRGQASVKDITVNKIDLYDLSSSLTAQDVFFFSGDSITASAYNRVDDNRPSFAEDVHAANAAHFPAMIDGGFGGWNSQGAAQNIQAWLTLNPDAHYWLLGWGSNDALQMVSPADFRANLQAIVDAIKKAGRVPIFARIPYSTYQGRTYLDQGIRGLNAVIDQITATNHLIPGPDLYALFHDHPSYLGPDGLHPTAAGAVAMNEAWAVALQSIFPKP